MPEDTLVPPPPRSLAHHPELLEAAVYEREIDAPIARVWENVLDWEHLPWLHDQAFDSIELREAGEWGWHADVGFPGGASSEIELSVDHEASCYVARTRSGVGAPGEIWTHLKSSSEATTSIRVEFWVAPLPEGTPNEVLGKIGEAYLSLYAGLWDQDEEMMQQRIEASNRCEETGAAGSFEIVELGEVAALREKLPLVVNFEGHPFRLVDIAGELLAHATECPHWLGPLESCEIERGEITCPWHGYRFDVATGRSADEHGLRLRHAPRVEVDPATGNVRLVASAEAVPHEGHPLARARRE